MARKVYGTEKGPTGRKRNKFATRGFYRKGGKMIGEYTSYGVEGEKQARRAMHAKAGNRAIMLSTENETRHTVRKLRWTKKYGASYPKQRES